MSAAVQASTQQPILDVRSVSKRFGGVEALKSVSLQLYPGEVVALAGDNGAGKSTLTKMISGVYPADGGEIRLDGRPVKFATPESARAEGIETIYQDLALADNLSIGANIFLGREPMRRAFGVLPVLDRGAMAAAAKTTMATLDFHVDRLDAPVGRFSGGQRQAVAIGRAMYWNARVILMDEPTAALGVPEQRKVICADPPAQIAGAGGDLHLPQPAGHLRGFRPHRRSAARHGGGRAPDRGHQPRRGRQADDRRLSAPHRRNAPAVLTTGRTMEDSMTKMTTAERRGYQQICGRDGAMMVIAADQRGGMRQIMAASPAEEAAITEAMLGETKADLTRYLASQASCILLDPVCAVPGIVDDGVLARDTALLIGLDASGFDTTPEGYRNSRLVPGIDARSVRALGGTGGKIMVYLRSDRPDANGPNIAILKRCIADFAAEDMLLVVEFLTYELPGEEQGRLQGRIPRPDRGRARASASSSAPRC